MKNFYINTFLIAILIFAAIGIQAQNKGYNIELKVNNLSESTVILGHYFGGPMYPDDTVKLDKNGYGVLAGSEKLDQGMYIFFFENGSYFDVMIGEDQHFSLETDTLDYVSNLKVSGSSDNEIFSEFQLYMLSKRDEMDEIQKELKNSESEKEKEKLQKRMVDLNKERLSKIDAIIADNPDLFVSTFLKATLEIEVPDSLKSDQKKSYTYYKNHYFDNFDLADVRLLYTPLYENKVTEYLDKIVLQIPDSLIKEIDMIIDKSKTDSALYRFVLITLFNKYGKSQYMGMDAVQVHIADKYYIKDSWWSDEKFITDLEERVAILKPLLIGKKAPNVQLRNVPSDHFKQAANDTALKRYPHPGSFFNINDVGGDFTVLIFWEANCSHCKTVVPKLHEIYQDTLAAMNINVIAISTLFGEDGKEKWVDFVNKNELYDWINAWNPYDYKFKETYDVRSTPQMFVLDKDKKIIGKKLGPENVVELINAYKKHNTE